jgi:hypothetical protein
MANRTAGLKQTKTAGNFYPTVPVLAGATIFHGTMVGVDASGRASRAAPTSTRVLGVLHDQAADVVNTTGGDGAVTAIVTRGKAFEMSNSATNPVTAAHIGAVCTVEDDNTVSAPGTAGRVNAGRVVSVTSTFVQVYFD